LLLVYRKKIKAGEHVVLYTRIGAPTLETRPDGNVYHFVFRGLTKTLFDDPKSTVAIMEIANWVTPPFPNPAEPLITPTVDKPTLDYLKMMRGGQ
jgi:hypothetical protein